MPEEDREEELRAHQDGRVYPLGRALRATYDANNHETLGSDVTGLMIDLSKVPYDPTGATVVPAPPPPQLSPPARSWADRLGHLFGSRRA